MSTSTPCPNCGKATSSTELGGLCPACLLGEALGSDSSRTEDSESGGPLEGTQAHSPTPNEQPESRALPRATGDLALAGRYRLRERIGTGGMGEVWLAEQTEPVQRKVAVKLVKTGKDSRAVLARFEQERQALAVMDHPNIARVLDGGMTPNDEPFFVMDLVDGLTLSKHCDQAKLTPQERLELFVPICQAVQHAHQKGIVHRDLKPANILVSVVDGKPVPKVIDFGLAKAVGGELIDDGVTTRFGTVVGTLEYMAPEQAGLAGGDVDTRADIYSLGVILYELLSGTKPFDLERFRALGLAEMIQVLQQEEPAKPSDRLASEQSLSSVAAERRTEPKRLLALLRGELDWVVMKCLEKQRDRRYDTADALAPDVLRSLADETVEARPPSTLYRLRKIIRRNKGPVSAACSILLALVVGILGTTWSLIEANRQKRIALGEVEAKEKARRAERAARHRAEEANADMKAFSAFLTEDIIAAARPKNLYGGLGVDVTVRQALDAAVEKHLDARFGSHPKAGAMAYLAVGRTYLNVDAPRQAIAQLTRALALHRQQYGPEHRDTLFCQSELARAYFAANEWERALRMHEELLARRKRLFGPNHADTLVSRNNVAWGLLRTNRADEAVGQFEKTLERMEVHLGPEHPDTLHCTNSLAAAYHATGEYGRAADLLVELIPRLERAKGVGPESSLSLNATNTLAAVYFSSKRVKEAIPVFERLLPKVEKLFGPSDFRTLSTMRNLTRSYVDNRDYGKAEPLLGRLVESSRAADAPLHRALDSLLAELGLCRLNLGRHEEAEAVLRECLSLREQTKPNAWQTFSTESMLGEALAGQALFDEAERHLLDGYAGLRRLESEIPPDAKIRKTEAVRRLMEFYSAKGEPDKASEWKKELEALRAAR